MLKKDAGFALTEDTFFVVITRAVTYAYFFVWMRLLLLVWNTIDILYLVHSNFCEKENKMHVCKRTLPDYTTHFLLAEISMNYT